MKKAVLLLLVLSVVPALWAQNKYALVIGNAGYTGIPRLSNPENDANDMAAALEELNFTVDKVLNGNLDEMETAVQNLKRRLGAERNSYGFFYYAGHGVQSGGDNYLIPVDANNIQSESHLRQRAVSVQTLLDNLTEAGNELNIVVLDACRDNPFGWSRSGNRGLSVVSWAPAGSIIMYATSANSAAEDGTGRNGLFTAQLLKNIRTTGLTVREVFDRTGQDVINASGGKQHPEIFVRFFETAYLGTGSSPPAAPPSTQTSVPAPTPPPVSAPARDPVEPGFVRINGGTFFMGSPGSEAQRNVDEIQHQVTVRSFSIGIYPVTQKEYEYIMGTNPSSFKGGDLPVEQVSWFDAVEYCNKRSREEGLTPAYTITGSGRDRKVTWDRNANGYRLPTEAEWEYACRADTTTPFNTGNNITTSQANYNGNNLYSGNAEGINRLATTLVGSFAPNSWGLYDMHGNVWEWCWDLYGRYPASPQTDPLGDSSGSLRVIRGGGWDSSGQLLRSAYRSNGTPSGRNEILGFRLVHN